MKRLYSVLLVSIFTCLGAIAQEVLDVNSIPKTNQIGRSAIAFDDVGNVYSMATIAVSNGTTYYQSFCIKQNITSGATDTIWHFTPGNYQQFNDMIIVNDTVYVVGEVRDGFTWEGYTFNNASEFRNNRDFVMVLTTSGQLINCINLNRLLPGSAPGIYVPQAVAVSNGKIVVGGNNYLNGSNNWAYVAVVNHPLDSITSLFVDLKTDTTGSSGGANKAWVYDLKADGNHAYVVGAYQGIDSFLITSNQASQPQGYVLSMNLNTGALDFGIGLTGSGRSDFGGIALGDNDSLYVVGRVQGTNAWDGSPLATSGNVYQGVVITLGKDGSLGDWKTYTSSQNVFIHRIENDPYSGGFLTTVRYIQDFTAGSMTLTHDSSYTVGAIMKINAAKQAEWMIGTVNGASENYLTSIAANTDGYVAASGSADQGFIGFGSEIDSLTSGTGFNSFTVLIEQTEVINGIARREEPRVRVFPNPVQDHLHFTGDERFCYRVFNTMGAIVAEGKGRSIPTSTWASGVYILQLDNHVDEPIRIVKP